MRNKNIYLILLAGIFLLSCKQLTTKDLYDPTFPLGPFVRAVDVNPIISPDKTSRFFDPVLQDSIAWESNDTFNPGAAVLDNKIVILYRAEDGSGQGLGNRTSRLGYACSTDGLHFNRQSTPVFYSDNDAQKKMEWPGGCEDPRIALSADGTYVMFYTQWNRQTPRLAVATSTDLKHWTKHGSAFTNAYNGRFADIPSKSASIVTRLVNGKQIITKINGKYWMYWGEEAVFAATSDNLTDWYPVLDDHGELKKLYQPRKGYFDSDLTECGPPAILSSDGIILLYNGKNRADKDGDPAYTPNTYCAGQALFSADDPTQFRKSLDKPFFVPEESFEKSGQYPAGTVFIEGLVYFHNKWFLYYGCADSRVAVAVFECNNKVQQKTELSQYVNPFIGASTSIDAAGDYSGLGKTFPGATTPFGMVQVSPNTITGGDNGSGYSYEHQTIEGFAFTQMSGIGWYGDLGNFLVMPSAGPLKTIAGKEGRTDLQGYRSHYDKKSETATAGYYSVKLTDYDIQVEATAAPHSGALKFTFPENKLSRIQIDLARRVGGTSTYQKIEIVDDQHIQGWMRCTPDGGGWGNGDGKADYTVYFYAELSKPMKQTGFWAADIPNTWKRLRDETQSDNYLQQVAKARIIRNKRQCEGKHIGFFTEFETQHGEEITLKAGISFVDIDGARNNFEREIAGKKFEDIHAGAIRLWNDALSKIQVETASHEDKVTFYTALYHTMIDPRVVADVDGRYIGGDGKIHHTENFTKRTFFSGWDVFRSQMPLQTLINPRLVNDELNSLITLADESGKEYYERWEFLNSYSGCMIGNPALSVLTDAYRKGIRSYDVEKAYRYAVNSSKRFSNPDEPGFTGPPYSISSTLEYAYFDWCLSKLAEALGKTDDATYYGKKGAFYRNVFDSSKGWFRPRLANGEWEPWRDDALIAEGYGCIESNPYQQGWFVPHDVEGMVELMGGRDSVLHRLDDFFEKTPHDMLWNQYYNHSNEPVHHVAYLYNRLHAPWKTQQWSRTICREAYFNSVAGLDGNEDCGQMSAWYVLSSTGLYPFCPGETRFEITSPVFDRVTYTLPDSGNTFTITAQNNRSDHYYIQSARLNGKPYNRCFIDYSDILKGGTLELTMGADPNPKWGIGN